MRLHDVVVRKGMKGTLHIVPTLVTVTSHELCFNNYTTTNYYYTVSQKTRHETLVHNFAK